MFRVVPSPIIRNTNNCIYSIWYWSIVAATVVDQYQMLKIQLFVFLMMGEETTRNM